MAEIAQQAVYAGDWGDRPAEQAQALATMHMLLARDTARSACRLLDSDPVVVYSHMILARSCLEASARARWIDEPGIGIRRRVARAMTERLYSIAEQGRIPGVDQSGPLNKRIQTRLDRILGEAERQGFTVRAAHRAKSIDEPRMGSTEVVRWLLADLGPALGESVFRFYSAVDHGTVYALGESIDFDEVQNRLQPVEIGQVVVDSRSAQLVLAAVVLGYGRAADTYLRHRGWDMTVPGQRWGEATELVRRLFPE